MDDHDTAYRLLFSHQAMVRDLLLGFTPGTWTNELDLDTLERVNTSYVTDDLRSRCDDVIWRVRWGDDWLYVYILLEFQSSVDRFMAVRITAYVALLYQDLIRGDQLESDRLLPPVLPVVLYNGEPRWRAPQHIADLIHPGPGALPCATCCWMKAPMRRPRCPGNLTWWPHCFGWRPAVRRRISGGS